MGINMNLIFGSITDVLISP